MKKSNRKRVVTVLGLILVGIMSMTLLTGCGKEKTKEGTTVYIGNSVFESSLDPIKGGMSDGYAFTNNSLTKLNPESNYIGDLAESWQQSSDALKYTFVLKQGIKFHNGSDLTAEDVLFTYNKTKENQGNNEKVDLTRMASIKAVDEYTIEFTLTEPYSSFLDQTALLGIVPSDAYDTKEFDQKPIGTGPWEVVQYDTDQKIIVKANKEYFDGAPALPMVTILKMDQDTAISNAKSGQVDIVMVEANHSKEKVEGMTSINLKTMDVRQISLPLTKETNYKTASGETIKVGNNVTSDPGVRKALAIGIDRQEIIKKSLNGIGKPAKGFTDNLQWGAEAVYEDNQKEEANRILESTGWKKGKDGIYQKRKQKCQFSITSPSGDPERYQLVTAVAEEAKKIGIQIDVHQNTWDEIPKLASSMGVIWGWGQFDPITLKSLFYSKEFTGDGMGNTIRYANDKVDGLIETALGSSEHKQAIESWKQVQKETEADNGYLYIVNIEHCYFVNNKLDISLETQIPHPHGHGTPIINNMKDWSTK